mgnify:CR=1 FL=1
MKSENRDLQHSACQRLRWGAKHSPSILEGGLVQDIIVNYLVSPIVLFKIRLDHPGYSSGGSDGDSKHNISEASNF